MKNPNAKFPLVPFAVLGAIVVGGLLWAKLQAAPAVPVSVLSGLASSGSERQESADQASLLSLSRASLARLGAALNSKTDHLTVWRVDRETSEFYAQAPQSYETLLPLFVSHTKQPASAPRTLPAKFWTQVAGRAANLELAPGYKVVIVFYHDGDNDDQSLASRAQIEKAARALAANPRVLGVWIVGAKQSNWQAHREMFAPLGGRLHMVPREQMSPQPILEEIDEARRQADSKDK